MWFFESDGMRSFSKEESFNQATGEPSRVALLSRHPSKQLSSSCLETHKSVHTEGFKKATGSKAAQECMMKMKTLSSYIM